MIHVITNIRRPSLDMIQGFSKIGAATVYEASNRKGAVDPAIAPIARGIRLCGAAFTVQCPPNDNLMLHKALAMAQPGDVILASVGGHYEAGYWGALMTTSALARELGGLAIDGCVRDAAQLMTMGFPVFSRGFCMRGTTKQGLGLINHTIVFGGIIVNPGDLVLGDDDGIVIVDRNEISEVLDQSLRRIEFEEKKSEQLKMGRTSVEINKLEKVFESLGMIED